MKHLIIIGAGGMGRSISFSAKGCVGYGESFDIKGFIDDNLNALDGFSGYPPLLGTIKKYQIEKDDVFVCSIGERISKQNVCEDLESRGAKFQSLISKTAKIEDHVIIGDGSIIADWVIVGCETFIGKNNLIQDFAIVGHDCKVGDYVRIDTHCTCVGGTEICSGATIHTSAVINHNVKVGENATVGALSFVIRNVKPGTTVSGNPARKLDF
jgi:sugar O-acyltransferase (sialic acid O-acetyltransferase NeuD family)